MIDLDALQSFVIFAEKRNFTHAAAELHISQPALHVKIAKLAETIGITLYHRNGRSLELTAAGRELARFGRSVGAEIEQAVAALRGEKTTESVTLAAGEGAILYLLAGAIREFRRDRLVQLRILNRNREGTLDALRSGEAQLGVTTLDSIPADLTATELVRSRQVVIMPPRHALSRKREITLPDLEGHDLIVPPPGRPHRDAFARAMLDAGVPWNVALEADGWPVMLELVRAGIGLAVVNSICTIPRGVVARPLRGLAATHYHLVHAKGRQSEAARRLAALIGIHP